MTNWSRGSPAWWTVTILKWVFGTALVLFALQVLYIVIGGHGWIWWILYD